MGRLWAHVSAVAACASACLFPSLGDLEGGGNADAGPAPDAYVPDARSDATADATADAASDGASTAHYCASLSPAPTFCEDFDEPMPIVLSDLGNLNVGGGQLALDTSLARSGARSLLAHIDAVASGGQASAYLDVPVSNKPFTSFALELDLALEPGDNESSIGAVEAASGSGEGFVTDPTSVVVQEGQYSSPPSYPVHGVHAVTWGATAWHHLALSTQKTGLGGGGASSLSIDGVAVEMFALDTRFVFANDLHVLIGFTYVGGAAAPRSARIDNVVVRVLP